ncbi:MAG: porin [Rhodospirillaceae bacterium]|nr:porin [Rhodospirillaceae bacterium]
MRLTVVAFSCDAACAWSGAPALGADPITLKLGGKLRHFFFAADQDETAAERLNPTGMFTNAEIYFDGRTILDNGIEVRATIELEAESRNESNADEVYIDFISGLGKLRIGEKEGVSATMIEEPMPEAFLTTEEEAVGDMLRPRTGVTVRDAFTFKRYVEDVLGVSYETPPLLQGVKFGVSYFPALSTDEGFFDRADAQSNAYEVAGRYQGRFRGGTYRVAAAYFNATSRAGRADGNQGWIVHTGVTYGGWDVAGSFARSTPASGIDETAWTLGALYGIGPYKVSANYFSGRRDRLPGAARRESVQRANLQGAYRVGPGISLGVSGFYAEQRDSRGVSWDGLGALGGAKLAF